MLLVLFEGYTNGWLKRFIVYFIMLGSALAEAVYIICLKDNTLKLELDYTLRTYSDLE